MPNPLSSLKKALLGSNTENVLLNGRNVEFQRMPSTGGGSGDAAGAVSRAEVRSGLQQAEEAEAANQMILRRLEESFVPLDEDPTAVSHPDLRDNPAIEWREDPVSGELVGGTSVAKLDADAYGAANAPEIRRELGRRAKGGRMFDRAMPQNYPDASDPMHHYDRDLLVVNEASPLHEGDLDGSPGSYNTDLQRITLDTEAATPATLRHEQAHAAAEALPRGVDPEDQSNWLSWGSGHRRHPYMLNGVDHGHAKYLTSFEEMKPYMRDLKYQNYYGLADGSVEPNMKRPDFAALTDQLNAEGGDFHRLMEETKLGEATFEDYANMTLPALREAMVKTYMNLGDEGQRRMRLLYALLSGMPLAMAMEEDDGSE